MSLLKIIIKFVFAFSCLFAGTSLMASNVYKKCISSTEDICTFKYDDKSPDKSYWYGGRHLGPTKSNVPWGFVMSFNAAGDVLIYEDKRKITGNGPVMWIERNGKASFVKNWSFKGTLTRLARA